MLNFEDILKAYPNRLQAFKENILKEYLQHKILDIIFSHNVGSMLVFLGGTAIRIIHGSTRFSEDLDFDNLGLSPSDFKEITRHIHYQLELDGYSVEIKNRVKTAFRCSIKFPGLLFEQNLSGYKDEKILIQLDSEPQHYSYTPEKYLLNKFGIFRYINTVPLALLLSQKITALFTRKRVMGRDFFDVVYLMAKTAPDYAYLKSILNIDSKTKLIQKLKEKSKELDFKTLAHDTEPFLIEPMQKDRVLYFKEWLDTITI